ncbi:MAG: TonB-dependent receptor [Flavobacteriales bacterium]|nr:TonB-dependent receptor [Flavobacteriales bacterium]
MDKNSTFIFMLSRFICVIYRFLQERTIFERKVLFCISLCFWTLLSQAQEETTLKGVIKDEAGGPAEFANVVLKDNPKYYCTSDESGKFVLTIPSQVPLTLVISHISFKTKEVEVANLSKTLKVTLKSKAYNYNPVPVIGEKKEAPTMKKLNPKILRTLPTVSGSFEEILKSQPGVVSNNELSSQYSVRGGNFDENLVYVNDIEIYRPFLTRAGQQEGLSFVNADLTSDVQFSTGGFEAKYGDKMSSVLDIKYKEPTTFSGSAHISVLGGGFHLEDASKDLRFTQIHGLRYWSNQYLLGALDEQGNYRPFFLDYQTYLTYDITDKLEVGFLGNIARNRYQFVPETRESEFGTIQQALRLTVFFEGQEIMSYETYLGALSFDYKPIKETKLKFYTSLFRTNENETFDILGAYRLDDIETDFSQDDFGDATFNRGIGAFLNHARNHLDALVFNVGHRGQHFYKKHTLSWGLKFQAESIQDEYKEWRYLDSAGFSLPRDPDSVGYTVPSLQELKVLDVTELLMSDNSVSSQRAMGYIQDNLTFNLKDTSEIYLNGGVRFNYWTFNKQLLISPRLSMTFRPYSMPNWSFRAATGFYQQSPFYREFRDFQGNINENIKAQQSIHYVIGGEHDFTAWKRPFKLTTELYYKEYNNLIPYEIDNVRIRYYATNNAKGDAKGIDIKVNGEFVKGVDSWASLSVMEIREDVIDDFYWERYNDNGEVIIPGFTLDQVAVDSQRFEPGYVPRPTDQRVNFALFMQDYIPKNPNFKVHLNLLFGSGLPTGPPSYERYKDTLRIPPYRRVDIGFSAQLLSPDKKLPEHNPFRFFNSVWASLEVFNLLQIRNTISYLWINDVTNRSYAVPNYLTARRINAKIVFKF